jgi:spermidine/putrescine transport system substrate-binding protein
MKKNNYYFSILFAIIGLAFFFIYKSQNLKQSISVFCWYNSFDIELIKEFEKKTNIKVNLKYYASNEELIPKLAFSKENVDVVFPTDYAFHELTELDLLQPINMKKIKERKSISKTLLTPAYINNKQYGIPREWGVYGLVVNKKTKALISDDLVLYKSFFDGHFKKKQFRLATDNDAMVAINLIYFYYKNFFKKNKIDNKENLFTIIYEILKKQRKNILLYSDNLLEQLFVDDLIDMAVMQSDRYLKLIHNHNVDLEFVLSPYYNLKVIEYAAIPKSSEKTELAYDFINFIMEKETLKNDMEECHFFPARNDLIENVTIKGKAILEKVNSLSRTIKQTAFILDKKESTKLWMKLKS